MLFIYLYLHFSKCMLHQFAILFTVMWLCNFEAVAAGEDWSKSSCFLGGGGGGCLEASKKGFSWKAQRTGRAVSSELCYCVLTGNRARIWVKKYVLMEGFLHPSILQTDCRKYVLKSWFRHRLQLRLQVSNNFGSTGSGPDSGSAILVSSADQNRIDCA